MSAITSLLVCFSEAAAAAATAAEAGWILPRIALLRGCALLQIGKLSLQIAPALNGNTWLSCPSAAGRSRVDVKRTARANPIVAQMT